MVVCGTDGKRCCPQNSNIGGECNLSRRHKITPGDNDGLITTQGSSGWINTNPDGDTPTVNEEGSKPSGLIPNSTGEFKYDSSFKKYKGICGGRDKDCYNDYNLRDSDVGGSNISKLDEYYTACGFGIPSLWPEGQVRRGSVTDPERNIHWYGDRADITKGRTGICDAPFPSEGGFPLIESDTCNLYEERKKLKGKLASISDFGGHSNPLPEWINNWPYIVGDIGCHYKYRKDWALPMHGSPPRFTTNPVQGELDPSPSPSSHFYNDYSINRMKCCINVSDTNEWGGDELPGDDAWVPERPDTWDSPNRKRIDKNKCPIIGLDTYTNQEIEDGAGVYDPKSNVCARYYPSQDGPDTPDNWCSYRIMSDNFFTGEGRLLSPATTTGGQPEQLDQAKYEKFINLLTDRNCVDWLKLDFNESFEPDSTSDNRPRSAALAIKLADFFVWVSKHLADPRLTPLISQNIDYVDDRLDLLQQTDKTTYFGSGRAIDSRDHTHQVIIGEDGKKKGGLCQEEDETIAPKYIGDYDLWNIGASISPMVSASDRTTRVALCEGTKFAVNSVGIPGPDDIGFREYQMFMDLDCEDIDERCDIDANLPCEDKFYSKTIQGQEYTFPCVKYDDERKSPRGLVYPSGSILSPSGCGYSDPDIVTSGALTIEEAAEKRKCIKSPNKEFCCNTQNGTDRDIRGEIISDAALNKERTLSLLHKNFHAGYNLGKFLNFLTTAAAGAFLHYGGQTQKHAEFIKNMKIFSNRSDIFNWKNENDTDDGDYNKKYNKLLETRYGKICHCFWSYNVKYDTDKPATQTTDTTLPTWCMDADLPYSCTKYNFGNLNEALNPVARLYKGTMMIDQCSSMGTDGTCTGEDGCSLSPTMQTFCAPGSTSAGSGNFSTVTSALIKSFSSNDAYLNLAIKKDNYCWNYGCRDNNEDYTHEGGLDAEVYGLNTRHSDEYRTSGCQDTSICQSSCFELAAVAAQEIILSTTSPTGGINQDLTCDLGSGDGNMNCYIGVNGIGSMAPTSGGGGNYSPPGGDTSPPPPPSPPPSPSPSPSPGTETDLVGVILRVLFVIALIGICVFFLWKRVLKNKSDVGASFSVVEGEE